MAEKITQKSYKMTITPLTDIHIGTGEVINPGEYFVFDGDLTAYFVDLGNISARNEKIRDILLPKIGEEGWVNKLRLIKGFKEMIAGAAYGKSYLGDDTYDIHEKWGSKNTSLTVNLIHRGVKGPYIPGSSIKGCIRTALVAVGCRDMGIDLYGNRPDESERKAMGSKGTTDRNGNLKFGIDADPLNILKIADSYTRNLPATVLHRVSREGMAAGKEAAELQDYRECLPGVMTWSGQDADKIEKYNIFGTLNITDNSLISKEKIITDCDAYYKKVLKIEQKYWQSRGNDIAEMYDDINAESNVANGECLIRIGWGSGYEALSITGGKPPKTRALVGGYPAGWAVMRVE